MSMVPLRDILTQRATTERINAPEHERFLTIKLRGGGVVERIIGEGKVPQKFTGYRAKTGQFIYSRIDARNGAFGMVPEQLDGAVVSKDFPVFDLDRTRVDEGYWQAFIRTPELADVVRRKLSFGATNRQRVSEDAFLNLNFPLPGIDDQRRIADILDKTDALRAKNREAIAHLNSLGQSVFYEMFGDPVTNDRGWPTQKLHRIGALDRGVSRHRPRNDPRLLGGDYPLIQTGDVANAGGYVTAASSTYSDLGLKQSRMWPAGTLCITIAANIAKTAILTFDACFPDSVVGFTSSPARTEFVRQWFGFLQQVLERKAPESAQKNINLTILRDLDVIDPPSESQQAFARRVAAVERLKATHHAQLNAIDNLFMSLQDRAFKGEL